MTIAVAVVIVILLLLLLWQRGAIRPWLRRAGRVAGLAGFFAQQLLLGSLRVGGLTLAPRVRRRLRPAIVAVPLSIRSDQHLTLLANLVTLTPGTVSVDVAPGNTTLYVHVLTLDSREEVIASITQGLEARIRGVFA